MNQEPVNGAKFQTFLSFFSMISVATEQCELECQHLENEKYLIRKAGRQEKNGSIFPSCFPAFLIVMYLYL